jgi:acetylornithine/succinyldiaminopimelate/putrescine aminotransferase
VVPPLADEERLLDSSPVAVVVRPVPVGTSLSAEKLAKLFARCQGAGIPLIADEHGSGMGRCGALLAHPGRLQADFAVLGASLAGGDLPIGACLCTDQAWEQALRDSDDVVGTFQEGAGPLPCTAALTSLDLLVERRLGERARAVGETWRTALAARLAGLTCVLEVGGEGLLAWVKLSLPALMPAICLARNHRVLCGLDRSVPEALVFMPPLDVDEGLLATATEALAQTLHPYSSGGEAGQAAAG